jgi:hypothetical protein
LDGAFFCGKTSFGGFEVYALSGKSYPLRQKAPENSRFSGAFSIVLW